jgi:aminoglycoside phosphotransferase
VPGWLPGWPPNRLAVARPVVTHQVSVDSARGVVSKRFAERDRHEPEREWRALTLLAEHAPGLAPDPLRADLDANPAVIEMSLLPGESLGGQPLTAAQQAALVRALLRLWESVPVSEIRLQPGETTNEAQELAAVQKLVAAGHEVGDDPVVRKACAQGTGWFAAARRGVFGQRSVFGQGDSNLANFLWDSDRVRIVDFEDSGRSDRVFELAVLVEHLSAWHDAGLDAEEFIPAFDLSAAETARLADCRRLAALFWLLALRPGGGASSRNPPGTLHRQAERVLALL